MGERVCENGCGWTFEVNRRWHRFCSFECRKQHWISTQLGKPRRTRSVRSGDRRERHDLGDRGTHIYVVPEDFNADGRIAGSFLRKAAAARKRLEAA